ncbi:MAG: hypothetical protein K0S45_3369 [Nitrospira sp.]|nr:hypothetical protein [Nitrospira sp.]
MSIAEFSMAASSNGPFVLAMVLLVGLFMGLWYRMTGKKP